MSRSTQRSSVNTEVSLLLRCLVLSRSSSQTQREVQSARCRDHYLTVSSYIHQQAGLEVSTVVPLVVHVFKLLSGSLGPLAQPEEGPQLVWKARCTRQRTSDTAGAHASFATSHSRAGQHGSNRVSHGVVALLSDTAPRQAGHCPWERVNRLKKQTETAWWNNTELDAVRGWVQGGSESVHNEEDNASPTIWRSSVRSRTGTLPPNPERTW